jgi:hypothetical protein
MGEERLYLGTPHVLWMSFIVEQNEALCPLNVGFFSPDAVMPEPNGVAQLIEELGFPFGRRV